MTLATKLSLENYTMRSFLRLTVTAFAIFGFLGLSLTSVSAQKAKQSEIKTSKSKPTSAKSKTSKKGKSTSETSKSKNTNKKSKPKSPCQGLAKSACDCKKAQCSWISPKKKVDKRGRKLTAYCRKTSATTKPKKAEAKKPAKKAATKATQKKK